jgi:hypothetical protein
VQAVEDSLRQHINIMFNGLYQNITGVLLDQHYYLVAGSTNYSVYNSILAFKEVLQIVWFVFVYISNSSLVLGSAAALVIPEQLDMEASKQSNALRSYLEKAQRTIIQGSLHVLQVSFYFCQHPLLLWCCHQIL